MTPSSVTRSSSSSSRPVSPLAMSRSRRIRADPRSVVRYLADWSLVPGEEKWGGWKGTRAAPSVVRRGVMVCDNHVRVQQYQAARFAPGLVTARVRSKGSLQRVLEVPQDDTSQESRTRLHTRLHTRGFTAGPSPACCGSACCWQPRTLAARALLVLDHLVQVPVRRLGEAHFKGLHLLLRGALLLSPGGVLPEMGGDTPGCLHGGN